MSTQPPEGPVAAQTDWPEVVTDEAVELVLRHHLSVPVDETDEVLCLCDLRRSYVGPVGHRLHVAAELRRAGMLRPHPDVTAPTAPSAVENVTGVPVEQLRAMIRMLWPAEITPTAKRQLEALCAQAGSPAYLGAGECDLHDVCRDGKRQCPYHQAPRCGPSCPPAFPSDSE